MEHVRLKGTLKFCILFFYLPGLECIFRPQNFIALAALSTITDAVYYLLGKSRKAGRIEVIRQVEAAGVVPHGEEKDESAARTDHMCILLRIGRSGKQETKVHYHNGQ